MLLRTNIIITTEKMIPEIDEIVNFLYLKGV